MITFNTQEDFDKEVMRVISEKLNISVNVIKVRSQDYYSREMETEVTVSLEDENYNVISTSEGQA